MAVDLLNGLIGYFRANEERASAPLTDCHKSVYMRETGNPADAAGKLDRARDFSAVGKYAEVIDTLNVCGGAFDIRKNPQVDFTRSCWVNFNSISGGNAQWIWEQYDDNTATEGGFLVSKGGGTGTLLMVKWNTDLTNEIVDTGVTPVAGTWYHIVTALDTSNGDMLMWVNGTKYTQPFTKQVETGGAPNFTIGQFALGASSSALARICEFGCWDRLLEDDEVATLYNAGSGFSYTNFKYAKAPINNRFLTGLTEFWKFDACNETFALAGAHTGKHGGLNASGAFNLEPAGAPDGVGQSRNTHDDTFGEASWEEIYSYSDFDLANGSIGDWSMSVWIKPNTDGISADHIYWEQYDAAPNEGYIMRWNNSSTLFELIAVDGTGATKSVNTGSIGALTNTWHHLVYGYDSATQKLFIQLNGGTRQVQSTTLTSIRSSSAVMSIGKWVANNTEYAKCSMANWAFWNGRVISESEAVTLYNGGSSIDYHDMAIYNLQSIQFDNVNFQQGNWNEGKYAATVHVRADDSSVSGYTRQTITTKDESSSNQDTFLRYIRNYYTIPPGGFYHQYRCRVDMNSGKKKQREDGFRYYVRAYKHNQAFHLDGPCVVADTTIPHSFIHPDESFADEIMEFPSIVYPDNFAVKIGWMPTFSFCDIGDTDMEVFRIQADATNYVVVELLAGDPLERAYNVNDVYGPHDPVIRVRKVRGGSTVASASIEGYYFGYTLREPTIETVEDFAQIWVFHHAGSMVGIRIKRNGIYGEATSSDDTTSFGISGLASLKYTGVGYYSPPDILRAEEPADNQDLTRRKLATFRSDVLRRSFGRNRPAVMLGERDVTSGQGTHDMPYIEVEDFNRADSGGLGSEWGIITETGNGFGIESNEAICEEAGYRYWASRPPFHKDYITTSKIGIDNTNDYVGHLLRADIYAPDDFDAVFGYGVELVQTGASAAVLRIVRYWDDARTVLATSAALTSYAQSTRYILRGTTSGNTISVAVYDVADTGFTTPLASTSTTDVFFPKPGRVGIYGVTAAPGQKVYHDDWYLTQNHKYTVIEY